MEKLQRLRELMLDRNIDFYVIPTSDFHQTESVGKYFKCREYISGFTGSEGTLIVGIKESALWVDGRYYIQAEKELCGSEIVKMESGEEGVPTIFEYINENLPKGGKIGFDGRVINANMAEIFMKIADDKNGEVLWDEDLIDIVWQDRPPFPSGKGWLLEYEYSGQSVEKKILKLKNHMKENNMDGYIISTLDDVAWLTNMRGSDVEFFPVVLAYIIVAKGKINLFMDVNKLDTQLRSEFEKNDFRIHAYEEVCDFVSGLKGIKRVGINKETLNQKIYGSIPQEVQIVDEIAPTVKWKACKNKIELENTKRAHIRDGVAVVKFMYWLKREVLRGGLNEYDACLKLKKLREEQDNFIDLSFETIGAYESNGAIVHYHPPLKNSKMLENRGFFLLDSGGHYRDGTTDITRTIVLGDITKEQKKYFTAVLKGMIRLSKAKFLYGCNGKNLDILCRGVIWDMDLDYKHGTGHGVGHLLNVHEDPIGIRWRQIEGINDTEVFEEGMITSNEPGLYFEGEFGIRIENEMIVTKGNKNIYGQFMNFETITLAPIDIEAILPENLERDEIEWLNDYHRKVYETISPKLKEGEREWLKEATRKI